MIELDVRFQPRCQDASGAVRFKKLKPGQLTTDEYAANALYGIDERDALDPVTEDGQSVDLLPDVRAGEPDMVKCERSGTEIRRRYHRLVRELRPMRWIIG